MLKPALVICAILVCLSAGARSHAAERVVIYDGVATEVAAPAVALPVAAEGDLWVTLADLKRATRFVVKPQGVCRDELCFPIPKNRKDAFLNKQGRVTWFNLSEFARLVRQPVAFDAEQRAWYFGARAHEQNAYLDSLDAPDFKLPDASGKVRSLSEFRGKKVLLITWASW
jgi:hypothetical protein